jgi:hypothetical protein
MPIVEIENLHLRIRLIQGFLEACSSFSRSRTAAGPARVAFSSWRMKSDLELHSTTIVFSGRISTRGAGRRMKFIAN